MKSENPRINNNLSKKKPKYGMDLGKYQKIEAKFAKSNRLKNSSIPYMQRILNLKFAKTKLKNKEKISWSQEY